MQFKIFLIIPPGLEDLALQEVELKCPVSSPLMTKGGIEIEADLNWLVTAHASLKLPTRILLRITSFKVRDFPKLHQKFSQFKWNDFLSHPIPEFEISCSSSRLMHTGRIEETVSSALKEALIRQPLKRDWEKFNYPPQKFYIRLVNDLLTLSLDLSGDPLYKRGIQVIKGEAPLRENFAAALAMDLFKGIATPVTLIDPMCGSATLLIEALTFHKGFHERRFAFEFAPFFKGKHFKIPEDVSPLPIKEAIGFDLNEGLLSKIQTNLNLSLKCQDSLLKPINHEEDFFMICNPPYGERIGIEGKKGLFLRKARDKFLQDGPKRLGWLTPSDMDDVFKESPNYKLLSKRQFRNGGLPVTYWVWERL
jgi:putative N6-adenine-specific DNA methylase